MKIRILGLIAVFNGLITISLGQSIEYSSSIIWKGEKTFAYAEDQKVDYVACSPCMWSEIHHRPYFTTTLPWKKAQGNPVAVQLVPQSFLPLSNREEEILFLQDKPDAENGKVNFHLAFSRFEPSLQLSFDPIMINPATGRWEKIETFKLIISTNPWQDPFANLRGQRSFAANSVLASGKWIKLAVLTDGVYKVTGSQLQSAGVDISSLSSSSLNLFGNSFGLLPESNQAYRPDDLLQHAIKVVDGGDGMFNASDYLLFFGRGPHTWSYDTASQFYNRQTHLYTDSSFYFLNVDGIFPPERIPVVSPSASSPTHTVNSFDDYVYQGSDVYNLIKSGREWYGDLFDNYVTNREYSFSFPSIITTSPVKLYLRMAARTPGALGSSFTFTELNSGSSQLLNISGVGTGTYAAAANDADLTMTFLPVTDVQRLSTSFSPGVSSATGWTNYMIANARRRLNYSGLPLQFRDAASVGPGNVAAYSFTGLLNNTQLWKITDPGQTQEISFSGSAFNWPADQLEEFILFNPASAVNAIVMGEVANQDLHGLSYADLLIVTHPSFLAAANELALFHQSEGKSVHVVTSTQVYNEFSSGMKDITAIRQFLRMFYQRSGGNPSLLPKWCLLVGDGSYDNKDRITGNTGFIPTYQSPNSTQVTVSYVSDDYFVLLDDTESMNASDQLDMAIGRLPVKSVAEAQNVVRKIKAYSTNVAPMETSGAAVCATGESSASMGDWRNVFTFVADDEDFNAYIDAAEEFADSLKLYHSFVNVEKIFLDAFLQESTPGGQRYPEASSRLKERVEKGALVVNYIGHGGEVGWAHERILDLSTVNNWTNGPKLPLFMTATCEFSRFDDPFRTSAGEFVLLNPNGGGIGLFTTTRLVYSGPNEVLNRNFNSVILDRVNGSPQTLGEIFMRTKNLTISQIVTENTRNFTFLGDPAVKLRMPEYTVVTDSINGVEITGALDTLKALSLVTVKGHLRDHSGQKMNSFNGLIYPTVFDKEQTLQTLGNDPGSPVRQYDLRKNVVYKGKASVTNGEFEFTFIVPKDISFQIGPSKISYYAQDGTVDACGYDLSAMIGGTNPNAGNDDVAPTVDLFMNDENFVFGGTTDENPMMLARVFDENGINTVGTGIGHDLTAILDENTNNTLILNDYYESDLNTYKSGRITYPFESLSEGTHTLKVKVWDVYNNSGESFTEFVVASGEEMALTHVLNYPNPFTTRTQFFFEHNQACHSLLVNIQVFTVSGKLVKTINKEVRTEGFRIEPIEWDGLDDFGDRLATGTYIYRVKVLSDEGKSVDKFEKLVILN